MEQGAQPTTPAPPLAGQQITDTLTAFASFVTGVGLLAAKATQYQLFAPIEVTGGSVAMIIGGRLANMLGDSAVVTVITAWAGVGIAAWRRSRLRRIGGKVLDRIERDIDGGGQSTLGDIRK